MSKSLTRQPAQRTTVRCAIYTRKSTEEGLDQEFNTLDAQRESGEAYIRSQTHEGWTCLPDRYDDGGFTGGNMDRPALQRLLADIDAKKVDLVVTYKVDRLSRSLLDFARMMETFDRNGVSFVSVTQQFNTATSMGRLILNVLLSFAQFEREIISERTRDKMAASRRKGKWLGGMPPLGYDVDVVGKRLVVNEAEADQVRTIFDLYVSRRGLLSVVEELDRLGWTTKSKVSRKGRIRGGRPFTKGSLRGLLGNVVYVGKVNYKGEIHAGQQSAIVPMALWDEVQKVLRANRPPDAVRSRHSVGALLGGLLHCRPCGCAMTPSFASKKGGQRYRYYTCLNAHKRGWRVCPSRSIPANEIERFVMTQISQWGQDRARADGKIDAENEMDENDESFADLPSLWDAMATLEQSRLLRAFVERMEYDGAASKVAITFWPDAPKDLAAVRARRSSQESNR
jgi:site-specific DNA recombinase